MKKLFIVISLMILSVTAFANETVSVETLADSGLLKVGTKIGDCKVITSKLSRYYGTGPVTGMQIKVQSGDRIVMAILGSEVVVSDNANNKSEVMESFLESTTGGSNPLSAYFERKTSQLVRAEIKEISRGNGAIIDLLIETKQENMFGNMKIIKDNSIRCR